VSISNKNVDEFQDLLLSAEQIQQLALSQGADEVVVSISSSVSNELSQRAGKVETCKQARSMGISIRLLVDGKYSVHSASDPSPASMKPFLKRAIDATHYLEEDPHRAMLPQAEMGASDVSQLELYDDSWQTRSPEERRSELEALEQACLAEAENSTAQLRSITAHIWDSSSRSALLFSNGHAAGWKRSSFGHGAEITLVEQKKKEDGTEIERLPEAYNFYSARQLNSLPKKAEVAAGLLERGERRVGSSAIESEQLPILLENRAAGRIIGMILSPLGGGSIYEKRSCMLDKIGEKIASSALTIYDDPLVLQGLGSSPYTGDGLAKTRTPLITNGVLQNYLLGLYNARRLNMEVTTGGSTSNIIIEPGRRSEQEILASLPKIVRIEGFLGGNANPLTGDFSYGITGTLFEHGEPTSKLSEMNISGNIFTLLDHFIEPADNTWSFSSYRVPSLLFDAIQLSGL
jgi:PmbA protein